MKTKIIFQVYLLIAIALVGSAMADDEDEDEGDGDFDCEEKRAINEKLFAITNVATLEPTDVLNFLQKISDEPKCDRFNRVTRLSLQGILEIGSIAKYSCLIHLNIHPKRSFFLPVYYLEKARKKGWGNIIAYIQHFRYKQYLLCEESLNDRFISGEKEVSEEDKALINLLKDNVFKDKLDSSITEEEFTDGFVDFFKNKENEKETNKFLVFFGKKYKTLGEIFGLTEKACERYLGKVKVLDILTLLLDNEAIVSRMNQDKIGSIRGGKVCKFLALYPDEYKMASYIKREAQRGYKIDEYNASAQTFLEIVSRKLSSRS